MKTSTKFRMLLTFLALALCLAGCDEAVFDGSHSGDHSGNPDITIAVGGADSAQHDPVEWLTPPDGKILAGNNYSQAIDSLYQICFNQPETLASTMSCFPSLLRACGVETDDPLEIDELLSTGENGGKLQEALLSQLQNLLNDPETQFQLSIWSGRAELLGMETIDPSQPLSPANVRLIWYEEEVIGAQILGIAHPIGQDGGKEYGFFYLPGGFQRLVPIIRTTPHLQKSPA